MTLFGPFCENLAKTRLQIFLAIHILFLVGPFALWSSAAECSSSWQHCKCVTQLREYVS
jgi:hypothetical protein